MKKLLHRKGNKLFSYRIWEDDKEITNDWKRRKEIEDEALEELTKPHLPGDRRMQYNKGRAEDDFPASLADGHPRLILAYVIIKGIQVHPSKVEVEE